MSNSFVYTNYQWLSGNELDDDFDAACMEYGVPKGTELTIVPVKSITGHTAYLVSWDDDTDTSET